MHPKVKQARIVWLLSVAASPVVYAQVYMPRKLIVPGDAAATAQNVLANESVLRLAVLAELWHGAVFIVLALALHRLLADVDRWPARLMVAFVVAMVAVSYVNAAHNLGALALFSAPEFLGGFDATQREGLGYLFLHLHTLGTRVNQMFWGVWLLPFGWLVVRSRFIPRLLGVWLLLDGAAWIVSCIAWVMLPEAGPRLFSLLMPLYMGELGVYTYMLVKGVNVDRLPSPVSA
jgi:hypothetical protein